MLLRFNDFLNDGVAIEDDLVAELAKEIRNRVKESKTEKVRSKEQLLKLIGDPRGKLLKEAANDLFQEYIYWIDIKRAADPHAH